MFRGINRYLKALSVIAFVARGILAAEPGLVAHYTFDEGSGAVARDASPTAAYLYWMASRL